MRKLNNYEGSCYGGSSHNYQPRYMSTKETTYVDSRIVEGSDYVYDICIKCGKIVIPCHPDYLEQNIKCNV